MANHLGDNNSKHWLYRTAIALVWFVLIFVLLFSLVNLFIYFVVPVDGATIWVKQGPITVESTASFAPNGLQEGDVILTVQQEDLDWWLEQKWRTWPNILQRIGEPDPTTQISVLRKDEAQNLAAVPLSPHPGGHTGLLFFTHYIIGLAFLAAGWVILKLSDCNLAELVAALVMLLMALIEQNEILSVLGVELGWSMLWAFIPLRLFTRWFAYSFALIFALSFPQPKPWLQRRPYIGLLILLLNPVVTLAIMAGVDGNLHDRHAVAYPWSKNIYIVYLLLAVAILIRTYVTNRDMVSRNQLRWIAWGAAMATIPNVLLVDIPTVLWGIRLLPNELASFLLLFIPFTIMVAIIRYRLWNIDLIIRASLVYGALTLALGVVYVVLVFLFIALSGWLGAGYDEVSRAVIFFVSALVVAFLFTPLRNRVQRLINRFFYRNRLNYSEILSEMSRTITTSLLLNDLLKVLTQDIPARLNMQGGMVILDTLPPQNSYEYQQFIQGQLIWLNTEEGKPKPTSILPPPLNQLQQAGMWCCVPLLSGDKLLGLYGVGPKRSGEYYLPEERELLETLARQAGLALQNAKLAEKMSVQVQAERDLEIARRIQLSLLPAQDPDIPGLDIVGFSIPAEEVGGDFYHYLQFDDNRVGIAVGDVSGKGVSAALFMAVSVSTLQAKSPYHKHTPQLLAEMNGLLHKQMRGNMNTALLYTMIQQQPDGHLTLSASNAGLVSPLLRRNGEAACQTIEIGGLPLGVIKDVAYHACHIHLLPGDLILLCSDGVVEAMNPQGEMFGFDRLEHFLLQCNSLPATDVVELLRQEITHFVGEATQHDDITMVVVRVK
jgi:serine phosphatase RsbU (regulator of sigma subunit)